ncbi:COG2426 family protein [Nanoarchaeota archaeon]
MEDQILLLIAGIIVSMLPFGELRFGIPIALGTNEVTMTYRIIAISACILANIFVIPLIFLFLKYLHEHFMKWKPYRRLFTKHIEKIRKKAEPKVRKYEFVGLLGWTAIPFPGTGAWSASLVAWVFGIPKKKVAIPAIAIGVIIAGILVAVGWSSIIGLFTNIF